MPGLRSAGGRTSYRKDALGVRKTTDGLSSPLGALVPGKTGRPPGTNRNGRGMGSTITILWVDDHAIVRQGCRLLLEQAGFDIAGEASSGEDAYASCLRHSPQVVVVDLAMPGMGGLETTAWRARRCCAR